MYKDPSIGEHRLAALREAGLSWAESHGHPRIAAFRSHILDCELRWRLFSQLGFRVASWIGDRFPSSLSVTGVSPPKNHMQNCNAFRKRLCYTE